MRILLAEDDPVARELLCAYLQAWGHDPVPCENGTQAWALLNGEDAPRLLLIDWMMPGIDGIELCRRIKGRQGEDARQVYIILVTGKKRGEDVIVGLQAGADDYVVKPFDEEELQARINVGQRTVDLWEQLLETERLNVLVQTAGAAAHEINQPLAILLGLCQLMQMDAGLESKQRERVDKMRSTIDRISTIVLGMRQVESYATKHYAGEQRIVDFDLGKD